MAYELSPEQKTLLLDVARRTIRGKTAGKTKIDLDCPDPKLAEKGAAFVTISRKGRLRGCIGQVEARGPLWNCVVEMAGAAATQDTRFPPVNEDEVDDIDLEISVLTPMEKVVSLDEIEVGRHGLMMSRGWHRGLLLPQVATEWDWSRDEFLSHTAQKAGLPPDAWRDPETEILRFEALVFGEKDLRGEK